MLPLIIDGYNFLLRSSHFGPLARRDLEAGREALILELARYREQKGNPLVLVFDGDALIPPWGGGGWQSGVQVVFSPKGEKADDWIIKMVRKRGGKALVVTSDRELALTCQKEGATIIASHEFEGRLRLSARPQFTDKMEDSPGPPHGGTRKKGPSRRLSRKERQRQARLGSL
jgi:predicted RNA-binding protein with PIN domain